MFSGIVEAHVALLKWTPENQIVLKKPIDFNDLKIGDSLAVNGVCLTLEWQDENAMAFTLGPETLKITGWSEGEFHGRQLNIERSLRLGDRVHGHMMLGHVDAVGVVQSLERLESSCNIRIDVPAKLRRLVWKKGSLAINGVSLTINDLTGNSTKSGDFIVSVCLIPETLKRTNLGQLRVGDKVTLEADAMARAWVRQSELNETELNESGLSV